MLLGPARWSAGLLPELVRKAFHPRSLIRLSPTALRLVAGDRHRHWRVASGRGSTGFTVEQHELRQQAPALAVGVMRLINETLRLLDGPPVRRLLAR